MTQYDPATGYMLLAYVSALALQAEQIASLAETGPNGEDGWSVILDITRTADEGIAWLAQLVGVNILPDLDYDTQRMRVATTDGWNRGTPKALAAAAAQYLTGTKRVVMRERFDPGAGADPYHLQIFTITSETPDPTQVENAIMAQKPAGIILHYSTMAGQDFQELIDNYSLFSTVYSSFATFQGVYMAQPGT
jgi:hypothetical protein